METAPRFNQEESMVGSLKMVALCLTLLALTPLLVFAGSTPSVGSLAPEFTLNSQEGAPVSLKDFRGKWVVLYFYPKDFTSGCTMEGLNFKLLADTDHKVSSAYDSVMNFGLVKVASRHTFIINPEGKIAKVFTEVNPNQHSAEVLSALAELQK